MADALRESLPKLPPQKREREWKVKASKGTISQQTYDTSRGKKVSWKAS